MPYKPGRGRANRIVRSLKSWMHDNPTTGKKKLNGGGANFEHATTVFFKLIIVNDAHMLPNIGTKPA